VTPDRSAACGIGEISWPNMIGAQSRRAPAMQIPSRPINGRFITTSFAYFPWFSEIVRA
jgi:hypothetical protein